MMHNLELIDGGRSKKRRCLFRAYSFVHNWHGREKVRFNWFYLDRKHSILPYGDLIVDYENLSGSDKIYAEWYVRELFTEREAKALHSYLWETHRSELQTEAVMLPVAKEVCKPYMVISMELAEEAAGKEAGSRLLDFPYQLREDEGFYLLPAEDNYFLPFDVWAFYDLGECAPAQESQVER